MSRAKLMIHIGIVSRNEKIREKITNLQCQVSLGTGEIRV